MEFRPAVEPDLEFVEATLLHRTMQYKQPERIDYCYTLEHENEILGIGGFRFISETTAWVWILMSKYAKPHLKTCYRCIKGWMDIFCEDHKLRRLQAYVDVDFPEAIRLIEHLGFEREFRMKNFMPETDAYMYVKFQGV